VKKYAVQIITILSSLSLILFVFGFGWTLKDHFLTKQSSNSNVKTVNIQDEKVGKNKTIVALGDSLTRGTGDASGKGYIGYLVDQLQDKTEEKMTLQNLGVKGYRSEQLLNQVKQTGIQRQIKQADVILITIGGNDLFQSGQTLMDLNLQKVDTLRMEYLSNLEKVISELRSLNEDCLIFFVGLYNPFIDLNDAKVTTVIVRKWNFEASKLLDNHPQTIFVPTFDLFQLKVNDYLYTDKFHPNAEGYKLIAERIASLITW
jgi:lysophospholipase L1-like esterase